MEAHFGEVDIEKGGIGKYANGHGTLTILKITEDELLCTYTRTDCSHDDRQGYVVFSIKDQKLIGQWFGKGGDKGPWTLSRASVDIVVNYHF